MHRKIKIMMLIILLLFGVSACGQEESEQLSLETMETEEPIEEDGDADDRIFVYVCGAVLCEGVYEMPSGSRVYEAIQKAGGFADDAAVTSVNQAEVLQDEMQLYIATIEEAEAEQIQDDGKVDLNNATKEQLMTLPGVGESKAGLIIQYREEHGKFQTIEDVMNISGIKEGLFGKIKEYIKV